MAYWSFKAPIHKCGCFKYENLTEISEFKQDFNMIKYAESFKTKYLIQSMQ